MHGHFFFDAQTSVTNKQELNDVKQVFKDNSQNICKVTKIVLTEWGNTGVMLDERNQHDIGHKTTYGEPMQNIGEDLKCKDNGDWCKIFRFKLVIQKQT